MNDKDKRIERLEAALRTVDRHMSGNDNYEGIWVNYPDKPEQSPASIVREALDGEGSDGDSGMEVDVHEPESVRNLPNKWRRINSGTGEYWLAARKVAQQCANELDHALAQHSEPGQIPESGDLYVCSSGGADDGECVIVQGMPSVRSWVSMSLFSGRWDEAPRDVRYARDSVANPSDWNEVETGSWFVSFEDGWLRVQKVSRVTPAPAPEDSDNECVSCGEGMPEGECPSSQRPCGHHCNHSWDQDICHWCGKEFGEDAAPSPDADEREGKDDD